MEKFIINGKNKLEGEVKIHGAKNAVLPLLCACVLCEEKVVLRNCPKLSDVDNSLEILELLGFRVLRENDIRGVYGENITEELAKRVGIAFGTYLIDNGKKECVVGIILILIDILMIFGVL